MPDFFKNQHPRDKRVKRAQEETNEALAKIFETYQLSYGEVFHILSEYISICSEVMIERERQDSDIKEMCRICGEPLETCRCDRIEK